MRRLLAPIVLAAALVGAAAPSASAESCYGTFEARVCFDTGPSTGETPVGTCLYTGGSECTPYYVGVPWATVGSPTEMDICTRNRCLTAEDLGEIFLRLQCEIDPKTC